MPVSIVDDEIGIFDTADPRPHVPQEVHLTLPHLNSQEIHLHTIEQSQLSSLVPDTVQSRHSHTHIFGRSEVEEQVISSSRLHMEDDGVIAAFLDLWPVGCGYSLHRTTQTP